VLGGTPFTLGVASGDPLPDGVVLWTRLAPDPLNGGGMAGQGSVEVRWELAADEAFGRVVRRGAATASPELGHSVHVDVQGLEPGREYFYRFLAAGETSPVGRTKTAPAAGAPLDRLRFAFSSCQDWLTGYYPAYRQMAREDLDLVFFLGDYVYEDAYGPDEETGAFPVPGREHTSGEIVTIDDYRTRYALHKSDPDLQAAHAAFPWVATWDDHEVDNDYAGERDEIGTPVEAFLARRAAGYQAFYEHLPLRPSSMPQGASMELYRRLAFGDLAEFSVLDSRQYRHDHPCGAGEQARCAAALDPNTTLLGPEQERWVLAGLDASTARWNVLAQQVLMAELEHNPGPGEIFWTDAWDGYPAARNRILSHVMSRGIANPIVLTGDWHSTFVNDLKADFDADDSPTVATEFVVTAISTGGDDNGYDDYYGPMVPNNPHIRFFDGDRRGYMRVEVTPERWRTDLEMVESVLTPDAPTSTLASFVVEAGQPGAQEA
jgi:alkaline phosphatase D